MTRASTQRKDVTLTDLLEEQKFLMLGEVISDSTLGLIENYLIGLKEKGLMDECKQCLGSYWVYDVPVLAEIHRIITHALNQKLNIQLLPSFSSARYYPKGTELERHLDRSAAEYSLTVNIAKPAGANWPLIIFPKDNPSDETYIHLDRGHGLLFKGPEAFHWREPLEYDWWLQAFFFFVDADGPFSHEVGDQVHKYQN